MIIYPAVAGTFYPSDKETLFNTVETLIKNAVDKADLLIPKAIIAPHAGYIYSGPIAASAFACLAQVKKHISRVVILAPSHQYPITSMAVTEAEAYLTPLGQVCIDQETVKKLQHLSYVRVIEKAFANEHAIEIHLPFLQYLLENFTLIPVLVGSATIPQIATVLEELWDGPETLIVVSSDLSHYLDYEVAKKIDSKTTDAIINLDVNAITSENACGASPIKGLLTVAAKEKLTATVVDLRNSGDISGTKDSVVGYGAFHFS